MSSLGSRFCFHLTSAYDRERDAIPTEGRGLASCPREGGRGSLAPWRAAGVWQRAFSALGRKSVQPLQPSLGLHFLHLSLSTARCAMEAETLRQEEFTCLSKNCLGLNKPKRCHHFQLSTFTLDQGYKLLSHVLDSPTTIHRREPWSWAEAELPERGMGSGRRGEPITPGRADRAGQVGQT